VLRQIERPAKEVMGCDPHSLPRNQDSQALAQKKPDAERCSIVSAAREFQFRESTDLPGRVKRSISLGKSSSDRRIIVTMVPSLKLGE
jgi:hypothetical protein